MSMTRVALATALLLAGTAALAPAISAQPAGQLAPLAEAVTSDLPRTAAPIHYAIEIEPDAANLSFRGLVAMDVQLFEPATEFVLHANDLRITRVTANREVEHGLTSLEPVLDPDRQIVRLKAPGQLHPGRYRLTISYTGTINTQANGLFALDYTDAATGAPRRGLFTQFEAPDARRFAPLFDEPSYKATFDLTAIVPTDQMAVSNMPVGREEPYGKGRKKVTFQTSPKMSSYLLFFGLGDFERIAKKASDGTEVGVVLPRGKAAQGELALEALAKLTPYFVDYFAQPYPLPKLDEIAGPGQSQFFGAMENWGAIFTFERVLLVDPALSSAGDRKGIYVTVAHETAHQWFGNLVTMAWWDDLWLNEGFASWMETKASDHFNPSWSALLDRIDAREAAMGLDAFVTTHPIVQRIRTVEETNQAFDAITYSKGEAVISMLEAYAGADTWRNGLRAYMKDRAYGNAATQDLWRTVEAAGAKGLSAVANDFTNQPGIPLVRVTEARCASGRTQLVLEQSEFSRDRKAEAAAKPLRWKVPLLLTPLGGKPVRTVLADGRTEAKLAGCGPVVINGGQLGYFRTLYPAEALAGLTRALPKLAPIDQLGLLKDNLALSRANYQAMAPALDLLAAVPAKGHATVAAGAVEEFGKVHASLTGDPAAQAKLAALVSKRWKLRMAALGFEPRARETLPEAELRSVLIATLGKLGDQAVAAEARRRFELLATNPRALDGPLKTTWLRIVANNATRAEWDALAGLARASSGVVERSTYYALLARAADPALAQATLDLALTETPPPTVRAEMIRLVSEDHGDLAFAFAVAHRAKLEALIDDSSQATYFARLAGSARNPATITALETFASTLRADQRKPVDRTIGQVRQRLSDDKTQVEGIKAWLTARK